MRVNSQPAAYADAESAASVPEVEIRRELRRILSSTAFVNARRPSQFLRFIVECSLAGEGARIKEYLIGVEVFERPAHYDPKADPVVRIEAGRLRKKLADYYGAAGSEDAVIIELPKGGYIPAFRMRPAGSEPQQNPHLVSPPENRKVARRAFRTWALFFLSLAVLLSAALVFVHYFRGQPASTPTSLAVLPFLDLSNGNAGQYLSDGVAEELTTDLAQFRGLRVVAATSAFQFRGKSEDIRKIGQALNAEAVLEGSISQAAGGLRIDAQLIDARNGYHLWSKGYDTSAGDVLALEHDIVQQAARTLHVSAGSASSFKRDTDNAEAHNFYLQGRYLWNTRQMPDMLKSIQLFHQAIKDDPNYALAYAGLADTYTVMTINTQMASAEAVPRAKAALQRALELDPGLARAHATLGLLKSQCEWDWRGAQQEFQRAIELDPNYAPAHHWAGLDYMEMGQFALADAEFRRAQVLDPLSPMITEGLAENLRDQRRYDEAISVVHAMPNPKVGWPVVALSYIFKGMYAEALKLPEVADAHDPKKIVDANGLSFKAAAMAGLGDRGGALKILEEIESGQRVHGSDYIPPGLIAYGYALIGEKEKAFACLEKAFQQHDPALAALKVDPGFDSLRDDPRYSDLLKKVGLDH